MGYKIIFNALNNDEEIFFNFNTLDDALKTFSKAISMSRHPSSLRDVKVGRIRVVDSGGSVVENAQLITSSAYNSIS